MNLELSNFLVPVITAIVVWCINKPQKVQNEVLHKSIDNLTATVKELTVTVQSMQTLLGRYDERINVLEREMKRLNTGDE